MTNPISTSNYQICNPEEWMAVSDIVSTFHNGSLISIVGRPNVGKTSLVLSIAKHSALKNTPVLYFSLEMGRVHLKFVNAPLYIEDEAGLTVDEICKISQDSAQCKGIKLIIIDYLQLITTNTTGTRKNAMNSIVQSLKSLALRLHVPILLLVQLNKSLNHANSVPDISDLRECSTIIELSDMILLVQDTRSGHGHSCDHVTNSSENK